jgi:hypothetical protein
MVRCYIHFVFKFIHNIYLPISLFFAHFREISFLTLSFFRFFSQHGLRNLPKAGVHLNHVNLDFDGGGVKKPNF